MASQTAYQYWRHKVSGATYAVRLEGEKITGFFGPVASDDIHPDDLPLYPFSQASSDEVEWAQAHEEEFLRTE